MVLNLSIKKVKEIREAVKNGTKTKHQIALELNVGERSVRNLLTGRHYGTVEGAFQIESKRTSALDSQQVADLIHCYNQTKSMYKVAKELNINRTTVKKYLTKAGIEAVGKKQQKSKLPKPPKKEYQPAPITSNKLQQVHKLHRAQWTNNEIAEMLDLKTKDVVFYLRNQP